MDWLPYLCIASGILTVALFVTSVILLFVVTKRIDALLQADLPAEFKEDSGMSSAEIDMWNERIRQAQLSELDGIPSADDLGEWPVISDGGDQ